MRSECRIIRCLPCSLALSIFVPSAPSPSPPPNDEWRSVIQLFYSPSLHSGCLQCIHGLCGLNLVLFPLSTCSALRLLLLSDGCPKGQRLDLIASLISGIYIGRLQLRCAAGGTSYATLTTRPNRCRTVNPVKGLQWLPLQLRSYYYSIGIRAVWFIENACCWGIYSVDVVVTQANENMAHEHNIFLWVVGVYWANV